MQTRRRLAFPAALLLGLAGASVTVAAPARSEAQSDAPPEAERSQDGGTRSDDGRLRRVGPDGVLDRQLWRAALTDPDHGTREQDFERLLQAARRRPGVAGELRDWMREEGDTALGWTLRLAVRALEAEAGRGRGFGRAPDDPGDVFGFGGAPFSAFDPDRWGAWGPWAPGSAFRDLEDHLRELFGPNGGLPDDAQARSESFRVESGPDGVRVEVREREDGDEHVKTYEAPSLEELFQAHPELRGRLDLAPSRPGESEQRVREWLDRWGGFGRGPGTGFGRSFGRSPFDGGRFDRFPFDRGGVPTDRLGVLVRPAEEAEGEGLVVESVIAGSLAGALGVEAGDVLVRLNDRPLSRAQDVAPILAERAPGEAIALEIERGGVRRTLEWTPPGDPRPLPQDA